MEFHEEKITNSIIIFWKYPVKPICLDTFIIQYSSSGMINDFHFLAETKSVNNFHFLDEENRTGRMLYSDSQKHESSCLLSNCFLCISPEPLELQKSYLRLLVSLFEELSDEKQFFSNPFTKSADIFKNAVLPEKK